MTRSLSSAASGMLAQQMNLDVISNNLANVNTVGFKQQRAEFQDLMYQTIRPGFASSQGSPAPAEATQIGMGSRFSSTNSNFEMGSLQSSSNPLDLAITGNGFFRVLQPDGSFAYTRDGGFKVDSQGLVVNQDGYSLDPPITFPIGASAVNISQLGAITVKLPGATSASPLDPPVQITVFANPAGLERIGRNLFKATSASGDPVDGPAGQNGAGLINSGYLEGSNVQVVDEMVRMITSQRAYELNSKAVQTSDEMLSTVNQLKR